MKNGLNKTSQVDGLFGRLVIDVWDLETKKIVFSGTKLEVSAFLNYNIGAVISAIKLKSRIKKKKYTLRIRSEK